ncbi:hypothetical protein [Rhodococcus marinonascens]|uniref:hypothetical protein n=1 Tax=Rhodococcus marinonascens TaxID=38311 RepID=UPI000B1B3AB9|nr:hypothetical protein [Rhodococcus marinonascens]
MKKSVRAAAAAVLAVPLLAAAFAAPATAVEPGNVIVTIGPHPEQVVVNFDNTSTNNVKCEFEATNTRAPFDVVGAENVAVNAGESKTIETDAHDGLFLGTWECTDGNAAIYDGELSIQVGPVDGNPDAGDYDTPQTMSLGSDLVLSSLGSMADFFEVLINLQRIFGS